jgi:hypothetical protein
MNNGFSSRLHDIYALTIDPVTPTTLYAILIGEGVYKSTDGASTWAEMNNGFPAESSSFTPYSLAIDPVTPTILYVGTNMGVFRYDYQPETTAPSIPTSLVATAVTSTEIHLAWVDSSDNVGVTGYRIFRNGTQVDSSSANTYSDTGLAPATTYTYTVAAFDAAGNVSAQSESASATTFSRGGNNGNHGFCFIDAIQ